MGLEPRSAPSLNLNSDIASFPTLSILPWRSGSVASHLESGDNYLTSCPFPGPCRPLSDLPCHKGTVPRDYLPAPDLGWLPSGSVPTSVSDLMNSTFTSCSHPILHPPSSHSWLHAALPVHPAHLHTCIKSWGCRVGQRQSLLGHPLLIGIPSSVTSLCAKPLLHMGPWPLIAEQFFPILNFPVLPDEFQCSLF